MIGASMIGRIGRIDVENWCVVGHETIEMIGVVIDGMACFGRRCWRRRACPFGGRVLSDESPVASAVVAIVVVVLDYSAAAARLDIPRSHFGRASHQHSSGEILCKSQPHSPQCPRAYQ